MNQSYLNALQPLLFLYAIIFIIFASALIFLCIYILDKWQRKKDKDISNWKGLR